MRDNPSRRPRIDVPRTYPDFIGELLALGGALAGILLLLIIWANLPSEVPQWAGFTGDPADWDDRWVAAFPVGIAVVFYVALTFLNRVPHIFNYPWPITQENAAIQYRLARSMLTWLKALCVLMMVGIVWSQARVATGDADNVNPFMIMGFIIAIHVVLVLFVYRAYRCQDGDAGKDPFSRWSA